MISRVMSASLDHRHLAVDAARLRALVALLLVAGATSPGRMRSPPMRARARALPDAQRLRAIERLTARAGDARRSPFLLPLLRDPDPGVRLFAARRLVRAGRAGRHRRRGGLDRDAGTCRRSIGRSGSTSCVTPRRSPPPPGRRSSARCATRTPPSASSRSMCSSATTSAPSLPAVLAALDDDNREVRLRAVRLAAASGDPRAALSLLGRLEDGDRPGPARGDPGASARTRAPSRRCCASPPRGPTTPASRPSTRSGALAAPRAAATPMLAGLARRRPADDLARHAQVALGRLATPAAIAALIAAHPHAAGLGRDQGGAPPRRAGGGSGAGARARRRHADQRRHRRRGARRHRRSPCDRRARGGARPAPRRSRRSRSTRSRASAIPARCRRSPAPPSRPTRETRRAAFEALLAIGDARASAVLDRGLADPDPAVRELAATPRGRDRRRGRDARARAAARRRRSRRPPGRGGRPRAASAAPSPRRWSSAIARSALARPRAPLRDDDEWQALGDGARAARRAGRRRAPRRRVRAARRPERVALARAPGGGGRHETDHRSRASIDAARRRARRRGDAWRWPPRTPSPPARSRTARAPRWRPRSPPPSRRCGPGSAPPSPALDGGAPGWAR